VSRGHRTITGKPTAKRDATADERTLKYTDGEGWTSPKLIAHDLPNLSASIPRERERCKMLCGAGLVKPMDEDGDYYKLTTWGHLYLRGELEANNARVKV
jgi:hypothetical protein